MLWAEIFNQLNKETTAFFKFLNRQPDADYKMKEWLAWVLFNTAFSGRNMDALFNSIERPKVQGYHDFRQAIIWEAISRHNFTFNELNTFLFNHNKEIVEHVCEKAIACFDDYAPKSLKSCGN